MDRADNCSLLINLIAIVTKNEQANSRGQIAVPIPVDVTNKLRQQLVAHVSDLS